MSTLPGGGIRRNIRIGSQTVPMAASALVPRLYRAHFGRDMLTDLQVLQANYEAIRKQQAEGFSIGSLSLFEDIAWMLAKHAEPDKVPDNPDEWLDGIEGMLSIYLAMPQILELWGLGTQTTSVPAAKKKKR